MTLNRVDKVKDLGILFKNVIANIILGLVMKAFKNFKNTAIIK